MPMFQGKISMIHELIRNATRPVYILLKQIFQSSKGNSDKNVDLDCEQLDYYEHVRMFIVNISIIMNMYVLSMLIVSIW